MTVLYSAELGPKNNGEHAFYLIRRRVYRTPRAWKGRNPEAAPSRDAHADYEALVERGKARVAAGLCRTFTREEALDLTLARYKRWHAEQATRIGFEETVRAINSGCEGGCGPGSLWYDTHNRKVTVWPSEEGPFGGGDPYVWSIAELLKLAMPVLPSGQAKLL